MNRPQEDEEFDASEFNTIEKWVETAVPALIVIVEEMSETTYQMPPEQERVFEVVLTEFLRHSEFLRVLNLSERVYHIKIKSVQPLLFKRALWATYAQQAYRRMAFLTYGKCAWCGVWPADVHFDDGFLTGYFDYRYCSDLCKQTHIHSK